MIDKNTIVTRGDVYFADLGDGNGSCQGRQRPVIIIQNDIGNKFSPTVIVAPMTSQFKKYIPTHVWVGTENGLLNKNSTVLCEQLLTVNKSQLKSYIGKLSPNTMTKINQGIMVSLALS